ncbi:MAG TPA: M67 family metallopeptidase [Mycobacteriales bacterium]|nr:M67 family metallopeptidase [Mycobacteriales bacterium]
MLTLSQDLLDRVLAHARRDHPDECCGVIAGKDGVATRLFEMANADRSPTGFTFDSAEWLRVYREVDDADEELLAVYHSHTATEAYPSRTDVLWSQHNEFAHWLLVSTRSEQDEVRSFTITDGVVAEEPVTVT